MTDVDVDMLLLARQHYMELCRKGMVVLQQFNSVATTLVSGSSSGMTRLNCFLAFSLPVVFMFVLPRKSVRFCVYEPAQ